MSKKLNEIPADIDLVITDELIRTFRQEDCDPHCHCCGAKIASGMIFKLAYIKTVGPWHTNQDKVSQGYKGQEAEDEMLCENCTADDLIAYKEKLWAKSKYEYEHRYRGYTRFHVNL